MSDGVRRVLVLDDDPGHAALQKRSLERAGYTVVIAHTGDEAFAALSNGTLDIIVVDHQLRGGYTGIAFCATLRASGLSIPVVMVSASNDERIVVDALRLGVKDFVLKDSRFTDVLPTAVGRALERVQLEAQVSGPHVIRPAAKAGTLLIIEDDVHEAESQRQELSRTGYNVAAASGLSEALAALQKWPVELILLDQRLANEATGLGIYLAIRAAGYD